ncbi:unnamed protein product [Camellia sinensis]
MLVFCFQGFLPRTRRMAIATRVTVTYRTTYMVEPDGQIPPPFPPPFDPFSDANDDSAAPGAKGYVHIRIQQRNGRKSLTTVQGLKKEFSYEKILKDLKKEFCCNGNVVQDKELGKVIQLQGDQRKNVSNFLVQGWHCEEGTDKVAWFLKQLGLVLMRFVWLC